MQWNGGIYDVDDDQPRRRGIDLSRVDAVLKEAASRQTSITEQTVQGVSQTIEQAAAAKMPEFEPAEFAINERTGELALPNGEVVKLNAPLLLQIATLENSEGKPLPKFRPPKGFRPITKQQIEEMVEQTPLESDFWGEAWANFKTTVGLAASAVDAQFGNDDPSNSWSRAAQDYENEQSLGQLKASRGGWYSSWEGFVSGLGQLTGNVGGNAAMALPVAAAGTAAGGPGGTVAGAAFGVTGGASAYGEQATEFYDKAITALSGMSPETLARESPLYQQVINERPGISHEEAVREVAIRGSRAAGEPAALMGAVESVVGQRLAGNFLSRMGFKSKLLPGGDAVAKKPGFLPSAGRATGRAVAGGTGSAVSEMSETALGQAYGASTIGIGSDNPMDYVNLNEGAEAALGGLIFGALGGRARDNNPAAGSDLEKALRDTPETNTPQATQPRPGTSPLSGIMNLPAAMRGYGQTASPGPITSQNVNPAGTAPVAPEDRARTRMLIESVLDERMPGWRDNPEQAAQAPQTRQLIGQLMALDREEQSRFTAMDLERDRRAEMVPRSPGMPDFMRGSQQPLELPGGEMMGPAPSQAPPMEEDTTPSAVMDGSQGDLFASPRSTPLSTEEYLALQALLAEEARRRGEQIPLPLANGEMRGPVPTSPEEAPLQEDDTPSAVMDGSQGDLFNSPQPAPLSLQERRAMQAMRQQQAAEQSAANPQPLPVRDSQALAQQLMDVEDEIVALTEALKARPARDPRNKFIRESLAKAKARLKQLEAEWEEARLEEGPDRPYVPEGMAPTTVDAPEPAAASRVRTPDGRPMGVAPPPLQNPEPMSPEEAASRAKTQQERRAKAGKTLTDSAPATPAAVQQVVAASKRRVSPSTEEPVQDIRAQVDALLDPTSERDAVFVAENDPKVSPGMRWKTLQTAVEAAGGQVVVRKGVGVLLTTNPAKARAFKRGRLTDEKLAQIIGYSESKADALAPGEAPTVVQAVTPTGAVAAEQITSGKGRARARAAVQRLAGKGAKVVETTPEAAQERRAAATKGERVKAKGRAKEAPQSAPEPAPKGARVKAAARRAPRKPKADDETTPAPAPTPEPAPAPKAEAKPKAPKADDGQTRAEKAAAARESKPANPAGPQATDTVRRAAQRTARRGEPASLPTRLTISTGEENLFVDLRVEQLDEQNRFILQKQLDDGALSADDAERVREVLNAYDQLEAMLDAAVDAAEERLQALYDASPDGVDLQRDAEQAQVENENSLTEGERGRPRTKARTSKLAYLPLLASEVKGFLRLARDSARQAAQSGVLDHVTEQLVMAIDPSYQSMMDGGLMQRRLFRAVGALTDAQLDAVLPQMVLLLQHQTVAKQAMRGATEVARAMQRAENDAYRGRVPTEADHAANTERLPRVDRYGSFPRELAEVVNGWVEQFERAGNKFSVPVTLMDMDELMRRRGMDFVGRRRPNGKFVARTDENGKVLEYIIAVDWGRIDNKGFAMEVLAHEFGHAIGYELYGRASPRDRMRIDAAFARWRQTVRGKSVTDILREGSPPIERSMNIVSAANREYAEAFHEWLARNAALYVLNPNRPHLSVVEKFFKSIGDAMRMIYRAVFNTDADPVLREALDRWVTGNISLQPALPPTMNKQVFEHEQNAPMGGEALGRRMAERATEALAPLRGVFAGERPTAGVVNDTMKAVLGENRGEAGLTTKLKKVGMSLLTMRQIERLYRDTPVGPALSGWVREQQMKAKTANTELEAGGNWIGLAQQLDTKVRNALEEVMYKATHYAVHPDLPWEADEHKHLRQFDGLTLQTLRARYESTRALYLKAVEADDRVKEIYAGLRDTFTDLYKRTIEKQISVIENANLSPEVKKQMIARFRQHVGELREGPYFPLMREGEWIVTVSLPAMLVGQGGKDGGKPFKSKAEARNEARNQRAMNPGAEVRVEEVKDDGDDTGFFVRVYQRGVYFFNSEREALAARAEIEAETRENFAAANIDFNDVLAGDEDNEKTAIISAPKLAFDNYTERKQGSAEFHAEVTALLRDKQIDPEVAATLERLAIEALPEMSYRKSLLPRQNIYGASKNMLSAYAHRYQGAAHHYANVVHANAVNRYWKAMHDARGVKGGEEAAALAVNTMRRNQELVAERMKPTVANKIMNVITDVSSFFSLAFSPVYVMMNSMQPGTVTTPVLAGLVIKGKPVGMPKAARYLASAYKGVPQFFGKRAVEDFINEMKALAGKQGTNDTLQASAKEILSRFAQTDGERAMLESLLERGTLDFSWLNALEDAMRSGVAGQKFAALQRMGMAFPQQVEAMNRVVTALASYRLARDEGMFEANDETSLQAFADDIVAETQLDYSRANRPVLFNNQYAGPLLQFKLYLQGMYFLMGNNLAMAMRGKTKAERQQGLRTLSYMLVTHAAVAGAAGLGPIAAIAKVALVAYAAAFGEDEDEWKSGEQLMREMLRDLFGEYGGTVAERGLPALLGIDISDRVGLPVLADSRYANIRETDPAGTQMDKWVIYGLGAPYSNLKRVVGGAADLVDNDGSFRDVPNMLPAALRTAVRSVNWGREGILDRDGDTFIPPENLNWAELTLSGLGVSPLETTTAYNERNETKRTTARIGEKRSQLLQRARTGEDVSEEIAEFNQSVPKDFHITRRQLLDSKRAKARRDAGEKPSTEEAVEEMLSE